jgi:hypothetical protein
MAYWKTIFVNGVAYGLDHLEPFEFHVVPTGGETQVSIAVRFHDHCFTETFDPDKHTASLVSNQASLHEHRAFSADRYELSKLLPQLVRSLDGQRISSTRDGNLVRVTLQNGLTYPVFFTLRKEGAKRVGLFVVSAYVWGGRSKISTTGEMKFNVAVAKILKGEKPKFPRK